MYHSHRQSYVGKLRKVVSVEDEDSLKIERELIIDYVIGGMTTSTVVAIWWKWEYSVR